MPSIDPDPVQILKKLFIPSLEGYRGLILHIPLVSSKEPDLAGALLMHTTIGCKIALNLQARNFDIWVPEGISTMQIQLWMLRHPFEIRQ